MSFTSTVEFTCDHPGCPTGHTFTRENRMLTKEYDVVQSLELLGWDIFSDGKKSLCPQHARPDTREHGPRIRSRWDQRGTDIYCGICRKVCAYDQAGARWVHTERVLTLD